MPFRDVPDPTARLILTTALEEYCRDHRIDPASPEYEDARRLLRILYTKGHRAVADLKAALVAAIRREG
jgi:hypothetical protein